MCWQVLGDIVTAQELEKAQNASQENKHELEKKLSSLNADLTPVKPTDPEFKVPQEEYYSFYGTHPNFRISMASMME